MVNLNLDMPTQFTFDTMRDLRARLSERVFHANWSMVEDGDYYVIRCRRGLFGETYDDTLLAEIKFKPHEFNVEEIGTKLILLYG